MRGELSIAVRDNEKRIIFLSLNSFDENLYVYLYLKEFKNINVFS